MTRPIYRPVPQWNHSVPLHHLPFTSTFSWRGARRGRANLFNMSESPSGVRPGTRVFSATNVVRQCYGMDQELGGD
ncbi:hypothetical protein PFISCL1PPCAC_28933, partial [Pristionchus fissidentatus]